jgi:hypothetical protein
MNGKTPLLPLYITRKQQKRFPSLNEKNLVILLLISTVLSIYIILKHLPSNVSIVEREQVRDLFLPKVTNRIEFIHDEQKHQHQIEIPFEKIKDDHKPKNVENSDPVNLENKKRRETVKNVSFFFGVILLELFNYLKILS